LSHLVRHAPHDERRAGWTRPALRRYRATAPAQYAARRPPRHHRRLPLHGRQRDPECRGEGGLEVPATINRTWGFKKDDTEWKTPEDLTFKLVDIVSKGGNYLLNVGPTKE